MTMFERALIYIVSDYLSSAQCHYTLSVFQPESGIGEGSITFTRQELLHSLGIPEGSLLTEFLLKRSIGKRQGMITT